MHLVENVLELALYLDSHGLSEGSEVVGCVGDVFLTFGDVNNHHHVEEILNDGLRDVEDVDFVVGKVCAYLCNDTHGIFSHYCDNGAFHI